MKEIVFTICTKFIVLASGIITSIVSARYLGPELRGWYYFWTSTVALIIQFGNVGLASSNTYLLIKKNITTATLLVNSSVIAILSATVLMFSTVSIFLYMGRDEVSSFYLFMAVYLLCINGLLSLFASNLLIGLGRIKKYNFSEIIGRLTQCTVLIIVVIIWKDPKILLWSLALVSFFQLGVELYFLRDQIYLTAINIPVFKKGFTYSAKSYVTCLFTALVPKINIYILEGSISDKDFGVWSISSQIFDYLAIIPASIALVLLPRMMNSGTPLKLLKDYSIGLLFIMSIVSILYFFFGELSVNLLFGKEYNEAFHYLLLGMPGLISYSLMSICSQYLASIGFPKEIVFIWIGLLGLQLTSSIHFVEKMGAEGAMLSLSITYSVGAILLYYLVQRLNYQSLLGSK